jgi:hypothetical protein
MKALSLWQPWATFVAVEAKKLETRGWPTKHRGALAIHATQGMPAEARRFCRENAFARGVLDAWGFEESGTGRGCGILQRSSVVAVVDVLDCVEITPELELGDQERAFGIYAPGRFAWKLGNVRRLDRPVLARGRQGLWTLDEAVERAVREQLA